MSSTRKGIDPLKLKVGDIVNDAWDDLTPEERAAGKAEESCHCSFLVEVADQADEDVTIPVIRVIAHDLQAGDIVRRIIEREEETGCHCDLYFDVRRRVR